MIYTPEQCRAVMRETQKHLDADARLGRRTKAQPTIDARAAATTEPPARPQSFHDVVVGYQKEGNTLAEASRLAVVERPDLRADFVEAFNKKQELEAVVEKGTARRFRSRNDR